MKLHVGWVYHRQLRDFRAFTGAVSLKPNREADTGRAVLADFRAFTGAVSLKPIVDPRRTDLEAKFPRLHRRGLIEAKHT